MEKKILQPERKVICSQEVQAVMSEKKKEENKVYIGK